MGYQWTLGNSRDELRAFAGPGGCTNAKLDKQINAAVRRLILRAPESLLAVRLRFKQTNNSITVPHFVSKILEVNIDKTPAHVFDMHYEFLDAGPGDISSADNAVCKNLVQYPGTFPTFYDIPCSDTATYKLEAWSDGREESDETLTMKVMGKTTYHNEVHSQGTPGEDVKINRWAAGVEGTIIDSDLTQQSTNTWLSISSIVKPVTEGYITLYAREVGSEIRYFLGKYGPNETNPAYKRYKIQGHCFPDGECIVALCKLAYVPAEFDSDPLIIQNIDAIGAMMTAMSAYKADDIEMGAAYEGQSIEMLSLQTKNENTRDPIVHVKYDPFSFGTIPEVR